MPFSEGYGYDRKVWGVHSQEPWTETKVIGGKRLSQPQTSDWWWMASEQLQGYARQVVYEGGHRRWGIEYKALNELTPFYQFGALLSSRAGGDAGANVDLGAWLRALQRLRDAAQPPSLIRPGEPQ